MTEPWIYQRLADERLIELPEPTDPALAVLDSATPGTGYVYTDPVDDDAWPRITDPVDDEMPDAFPPAWSGAPTERDQAAIDAGNA